MSREARTVFGRWLAICCVVLASGAIAGCGASSEETGSGGEARDGEARATDERVETTADHADRVSDADSDEPIVVGVLVSHYSATGPSWIGRPWGYIWPTRIHEDIVEYGTIPMEVVAVVDPGTAEEPEVAARLEEMGLERVIEATDAAEMNQLDVIVLGAKVNLLDDVLDSILAAAELRGVGVWNVCFTGVTTPGVKDARVPKLWGSDQSRYFWADDKLAAEVVAEHPILAGVEVGTLVGLRPNGLLVNEAWITPLIQIDAGYTSERSGGRLPEGTRFSPLYVGSIGKGRVVCLGTACKTPERLHTVTDGQFVNNTLTWLAEGKREAEAGVRSASP